MTPRLPNGTRLTPGRVRSMSFRLARLGHRGLDEDDVRDFCGQVEAELNQLLQERNAFQREAHRLRGWARAQNQAGSHARNRAGTGPALPLGAPTTAGAGAEAGARWASEPYAAVEARAAGPGEARAAGIAGVPALAGAGGGHSLTPPYGLGLAAPRCRHQDAHGQAVRILAKAQQTADQYVSDAHAYSRTVAHDAQRRRERILAEAHAQATVMLEQAHQAAVRAGFTQDQSRARPRAGLPLDQGPARHSAGLPRGQGPAHPAAMVPALPALPAPVLPAPVPEPERRPPAPARAPDRTPAADPAIYNAVVARYPHVAPVRRELPASPAPSPAARPPSMYDSPPRYGPDPTGDTGAPPPAPAQPGRTATGAHRASQPRTSSYPDPSRYPEPSGYNLPAPPPDYSTVIDYPGPAGDYQALGPVHHERPQDRRRDRRDRSGRDNAWFNRNTSDETDREARRYLDQYRDPGPGDSQFPF